MSSTIRRLEKYPAWAMVIVGLCVFLTRYASPRPSFDVHRNLFFTGLVIIFASFAAVIANEGHPTWNYWSGINVAAGVWLIVSATLLPAVAIVSAAQIVFGTTLAVLAVVAIAIELAYQFTRINELKQRRS